MRPARILIVEDNELYREFVRTVLEANRSIVDIAVNGLEALEAVKAKIFDLVLMDIQMPKMDGITATKRIRAMPEPLGSLPIIAMTAMVQPDQIAAFRSAGMDDHIGKPFKKSELHHLVMRWLPERAI